MRKLQNRLYEQHRPADTVNKEGSPAWIMPLEEQFKQIVNTGGVFNTYYVNEKNVFDGARQIIEQYVKQDPVKATEIAIDARKNGFMRHMPIIALGELTNQDKELFARAFKEIIVTPRDLIDFIDVVRSKRGLGRSIKKAIKEYINTKLNEFYAMKYRDQLRVAAKLSHVKPNDQVLMKYIFGEDVDLSEYPQLQALEQLKRGEIDAAEAITKYRLEMQTVLGIKKPTANGWKALIPQMSAFQLIKNLATLERHLVGSDVQEGVAKHLTVERLQSGKVIPFRVLQAMEKVQSIFLKAHLAELANEYPKLYDFGKLGVVAIFPDVSGSMGGRLRKSRNDWREDPDAMTFSYIAGMLSGILKVGIGKDAVVIPWDTHIHTPITSGTVMNIAEQVRHATGGGTYMNLGPEYLLKNGLKVDTVICITDSMEWGPSFFQAWMEYKKFYPKARAILIRIDPYTTQPFPPEVATKMDIVQIYGWSDNVLKIIKYYSLK